jgi:hypothetical protein
MDKVFYFVVESDETYLTNTFVKLLIPKSFVKTENENLKICKIFYNKNDAIKYVNENHNYAYFQITRNYYDNSISYFEMYYDKRTYNSKTENFNYLNKIVEIFLVNNAKFEKDIKKAIEAKKKKDKEEKDAEIKKQKEEQDAEIKKEKEKKRQEDFNKEKRQSEENEKKDAEKKELDELANRRFYGDIRIFLFNLCTIGL